MTLRLAALLLIAQSALAAASWERTLVPAAAGTNVVSIDAPLLIGARDGFPDLRLSQDGREIEYILLAASTGRPQWVSVNAAPIRPTRVSSGIEADLGSLRRIDHVRFEGIRTPVMKRVKIEASGDRARWIELVPQGTIFDLPEEGLQRLEVGFEPVEVRFLRATFDDRNRAVVRPRPRMSVRLSSVASSEAPTIPLGSETIRSEPGKTRIRIVLPSPAFPLQAIMVEGGAGNVFRKAEVVESTLTPQGLVPKTIGSGTLKRAVVGELVASEMRIPIFRPAGSEIQLVIDDGDSPPLTLGRIIGELAPQPSILFEVPAIAPVVAQWGDAALEAPQYDLEAVRAHLPRLRPVRARWDGGPRPIEQSFVERPSLSAPEPGPLVEGEYRFERSIEVAEPGLVSLPLDARVLAHAQLPRDVRVVDADGRQIAWIAELRSEPLELRLGPMRSLGRSGNLSRYELRLPVAGLPASRLVLETRAPLFRREVRVLVPDLTRGEERRVAAGSWVHAESPLAPPPLTLALPRIPGDLLVVEIDEGDNPALPLENPRLLLPLHALRFHAPRGSGLRLLYGNPEASAPSYDVELLAERVLRQPAAEARLGSEVEKQSTKMTRSRLWFWIVVAVAALALLVMLARMLPRSA